MNNSIEITKICVALNNKNILNNLSLTLNTGSITCIVAPNGTGKTTFFKSIVQLIPLESGEVIVDKTSIKNRTDYNKKIFFIESANQLFANLTVYENMQVAAKLWKHDANFESIINLVGVNTYINKKIKHLSAGMKQKALLSVAIASGAYFLIFDEPLNGLDIENVEYLTTVFLTLKEQGKTLLLSSHNIFEISKLCDAIYFLDSGILKSASLDYLQLKEEYYELYATKGRA